MKRFVTYVLIIFFLLSTISLATPTRAILLIYDSENQDSKRIFTDVMEQLKSFRDLGYLNSVQGLADQIAEYDFAKNGAYLERLGFRDRDKVPVIAVVELEGGGRPK